MSKKRLISFMVILTGMAFAILSVAGCSRQKAANTDYDVIVIGGGMAGLSAGAHLATNKLKVLLLEQHDKVGGCTTSFDRDEFTFDASLHQMSGGGPGKRDRGLYQLLKTCGVDKKVELIELPHFYRTIYPGFDITLPNNWEGCKNTLKAKWPEEAEGIEQFHRLCSGLFSELSSLKDMFRYGSLRTLLTKAMVPVRQPIFFEWKDKTVQDLLDECFNNEDIKAAVSQLWIYYGAPLPHQTAIIMMAATEVYLTDGVWHIKGTSQALSDAYAERIAELGGQVKTDTLVTQILMENGIATGVKTESGEVFTGRYVVANTDPYQLVFKLLGEKHFPEEYVQRLRKLKPANSLFGVYLGLDIDLKKRGYHDTEIFYNTSKDSLLVHDNMMKGDFMNGTVAITIYSNYGDPVYAPEGKSLVVLNAYSDYRIWPEDKKAYWALKEKKMDELIRLASNVIPELANSDHISVQDGFTPRTIERYTMNKGGVVYGFYLSPEQWEKIPNTTAIENVFIASNWTQAWHGVGPGQINGWRAARLIMDREGIE